MRPLFLHFDYTKWSKQRKLWRESSVFWGNNFPMLSVLIRWVHVQSLSAGCCSDTVSCPRALRSYGEKILSLLAEYNEFISALKQVFKLFFRSYIQLIHIWACINLKLRNSELIHFSFFPLVFFLHFPQLIKKTVTSLSYRCIRKYFIEDIGIKDAAVATAFFYI